jgi:hypothetical protein
MSKRPTAAQKRRMTRLSAQGCLACFIDGNPGTPGDIHHLKKYGGRDHSQCYCLCPAHHRATNAIPGIPNRHATPKEFEARYGSDAFLCTLTEKMLGEL